MCTTTTHWATHISDECSLGGTGQCDSTCLTHEQECTCQCHGAMDLPDTTDAVRDWHDEAEGVVGSYPIAYPEGDDEVGAAWALAQADADNRNDKPVNGTLYMVVKGQSRVVVVWRSS